VASRRELVPLWCTLHKWPLSWKLSRFGHPMKYKGAAEPWHEAPLRLLSTKIDNQIAQE
jgi:hypothetical protein